MITSTNNTKGQDAALRLVRSGKNVFITGAGGVGKSYIIDQIRRCLPDAAITSTTAISAGNIGGVTLNSWAGLGLGLETPSKMFSKMNERKRHKIRGADALLIDEVSMLHPDTMEKCDELLQKVRGSAEPFGGLQVIAVGDFFQLPPVETRRGVPTRYAFDCDSWGALDFATAHLTEIIRQKDKQFQDILNAIRVGDVSEADLAPLFARTVSDVDRREGDFTSLRRAQLETSEQAAGEDIHLHVHRHRAGLLPEGEQAGEDAGAEARGAVPLPDQQRATLQWQRGGGGRVRR